MRIARGVGAVSALVSLLVGIPLLLVTVGQAGRLSTIDWSRLLVQRDDGSLLFAVLTVLAWVSWAVLSASIVVEAVDTVRRVRLPHLALPRVTIPGLDLPRMLVRGLVVAAVTLVLSVQQQETSPEAEPMSVSAAQHDGAADRAETTSFVEAETTRAEPAALNEEDVADLPAQRLHVVSANDDLWSLAHSTYGDGTQWRRIVSANNDVLEGPAELLTGTRLVLPGATGDDGSSVVVVKKGDTLWHLAKTYLGDGHRWREIYEANRDLIENPDEIDVGWRLVIPPRAAVTAPSAPVPAPGTASASPTAAGTTTGQATVTSAPSAPATPAPSAPVTRAPSAPVTRAPSAPGTPASSVPSAPATSASSAPATSAPATAVPTTAPASTRSGPTVSAGSARPSSAPSSSVTPSKGTVVARTIVPASATTPASRPETGPASHVTGRPQTSPATSATASPTPGPGATSTALPPTVTAAPAATPAWPTPTVRVTVTSAGRPSTVVPPARTAQTPTASATAAGSTGSAGSTRSEPTTSSASSGVPAPPAPQPPESPSDDGASRTRDSLAVALLGLIGAGTSAAVVRTLTRRRELQLATRPLGRRIPHAEARVQRFEQALSLVAADGMISLPTLSPGASTSPAGGAPAGDDRPPGCPVTVGFVGTAPHWLDLEQVGVLTVDLDDAAASWGAVAAIALELAVAGAGGDDRQVVAVGELGTVLAAAGLETIVAVASVDEALADVRRTVDDQRSQLQRQGRSLADARGDESARDAWWPRVYLFPPMDDASRRDLNSVLTAGQQTAVSAVVVAGEAEAFAAASPARAATAPRESEPPAQPPRRALPGIGGQLIGDAREARVEPDNTTVTPVGLALPAVTAITTLLETTGRTDTHPAPWFDGPSIRPDNVHVLHPRTAAGSLKEVATMGPDRPGVPDYPHPTLLLLGPIGLTGVAGEAPARAERSCIEYCAWMLENPGATAVQMASALLVAEGTRRSNVSRLRGWLGNGPDGVAYLPDAYTGRLSLDPSVSSDWHRLRMLIGPGITKTTTESLVAALQLVRGAPLADAAPGQWRWAEELRTDMSSAIRDIGAVLAERALSAGDLAMARWAAARALVAAPDDELLLRWRLKTEHVAGNRAEVDRLALRLTRHARMLGIDLDDDTVTVIQEAIEGQPRARA